MSGLRTVVALLLVLILAGFAPINTAHAFSMQAVGVPTIHTVVAVQQFVRKCWKQFFRSLGNVESAFPWVFLGTLVLCLLVLHGSQFTCTDGYMVLAAAGIPPLGGPNKRRGKLVRLAEQLASMNPADPHYAELQAEHDRLAAKVAKMQATREAKAAAIAAMGMLAEPVTETLPFLVGDSLPVRDGLGDLAANPHKCKYIIQARDRDGEADTNTNLPASADFRNFDVLATDRPNTVFGKTYDVATSAWDIPTFIEKYFDRSFIVIRYPKTVLMMLHLFGRLLNEKTGEYANDGIATKGFEVEGRKWYPALPMFGDKGAYVICTLGHEGLNPTEFLSTMGIRINANKPSDRWKAMKRLRRLFAPVVEAKGEYSLFAEHQVVSRTEDSNRPGYVVYELLSGITGELFTVLVRPFIRGQHKGDGASWGTRRFCKAAWGLKVRQFASFFLHGMLPEGGLKGGFAVLPDSHKLDYDAVIVDPKGEIRWDRQDVVVLGFLATHHKYDRVALDAQAMSLFGLWPFASKMAERYLELLKEELVDESKARRHYSFLTRPTGEGNSKSMLMIVSAFFQLMGMKDVKITQIPRLLKALWDMNTHTLRDMFHNRTFSIEMPTEWFERAYIYPDYHILKADGDENFSLAVLKQGHVWAAGGQDLEAVAYRQPMGKPNSFNLYYQDDYGKTMTKSEAKDFEHSALVFISPEGMEEHNENIDGADFDDSIVKSSHPLVVNHFKWLGTLPYPDKRPAHLKPQPPKWDGDASVLDWNWENLQKMGFQAAFMGGIGQFINPLIIWTAAWLLLQIDAKKWAHLRPMVDAAPMHIIGNETEVIIDSFLKEGGLGINEYWAINDQFMKALKFQGFITPFFLGRVTPDMAEDLAERGAIEQWPVDQEISAIKALYEQAEEWFKALYATTPQRWADNKLAFKLDQYPVSEEMEERARRIRKAYAKWFRRSSDDEEMDADEYQQTLLSAASELEDHLDQLPWLDYVQCVVAMWRQIYAQPTRNQFRDSCLWNMLVLPEVLDALQYVYRSATPMSKDSWTPFWKSPNVSNEEKWHALGARAKAAIMRLVYQPIGETGVCRAIGEVYITMPDGSLAQIGFTPQCAWQVDRLLKLADADCLHGHLALHGDKTLLFHAVQDEQKKGTGAVQEPAILSDVPARYRLNMTKKVNEGEDYSHRVALPRVIVNVCARNGEWDASLAFGRTIKDLYGVERTSDNRLALLGINEALACFRKPSAIQVFADNGYLVSGANQWLAGWKARNWKTKDGSALKNQDQWVRLDHRLTELRAQGYVVSFYYADRPVEAASAAPQSRVPVQGQLDIDRE